MLAAVEVHPSTSSLGFVFPWDASIGGRPLLAETVEAIGRCPSIDRIAVLIPAEESAFESSLRECLRQTRLPAKKRVLTLPAAGLPGYPRDLLSRWRRLAPSAWRAGWAVPFALAERADPGRLLALFERTQRDEVILFPAQAPFVEPDLVEQLLSGRQKHPDTGVRLSTLPPGLAGDVVGRSYVGKVIQARVPLDYPLRFLPGQPQRDLDTKGAFHWFSEEYAGLRHRLTAESRRGLEILKSLTAWRASVTSGDWVQALLQSPECGALLCGPMPAEVRVRVTSGQRRTAAFDLPHDRGPAPGEKHMKPELFEQLIAELAPWQDIRVVICGGEPTLHPEFERLLELARQADLGTVLLETDGMGLGADCQGLLSECVDGVIVAIDAVRSETYCRLHGDDCLGEVEKAVSELNAISKQQGMPFVAVEMRLVEENQGEVEDFIDRWFAETSWVVVSPFRSRAGQLARGTLHPHTLPKRRPCVRLEDQVEVFPDGRVAVCDNDIHLLEPAGDLRTQSLGEIWSGDRMASLRRAHGVGDWTAHPLCARCDDWCRR